MIGNLRRRLGIEAKSTLANPSPELFALFGASPTASGTSVTPETALRCPTVYACVKVLSETIAQLPLHLYQRLPDGGKERASDHPLAEILHDAANEWTSSPEFRLGMQVAVLLHGNAFAFINRAGGHVVELVQIASTAVQVEVDAATQEPSYLVTSAAGGQRRYHRDEILHLRTLGTNAYLGLSPVMQAREAIGVALAMDEHAGRLFGNGARPSGVLEHSGKLGAEALARLRSAFDGRHAGGANSGRTLILEEGLTWKAVQFTSVDLQFLELRRHQIAEIARVFRVPLHLLQELERTTHNNAEQMGQQFLSLTILPWLKLWEAAIRRSLLTPDERATYYAEFLTDDLARADQAGRFSSYATAVTNGILSPNEVRAAENRPPYAGGDEFHRPLNTAAASTGGAA